MTRGPSTTDQPPEQTQFLNCAGALKALDWVWEQPLRRLEAHVAVAEAIERYRASNADFADFLIASAGSEAGCATTFTFDKAASAIEGFSLLKES